MHYPGMQVSIFPGQYIQGAGAIRCLPEITAHYGDRPCLVATKSMVAMMREVTAGQALVGQFSGECSDQEIRRIMDLARGQASTALVAVGGGKVIDSCKIAADQLDIPVIVVPTIASTDAPCSGCAVVYTESGVFQAVHYQKRNPDVVLVDTELIARAPLRFLISGMGDGMATFFEANSCQRSRSPSECGGLQTRTAMVLARLCLDTILHDGRQAIRDCQQGVLTEAVEAIIEANTLLSGLGFESGGLAAAHSVHNGLTLLAGTHSRFHGEKVAFGVLTGLQLIDEFRMKDQVYDFFLDVGLPVCFADLGIGGVTESEIFAVAENCCSPGSTMHHEPVSIDVQKVASALKAADAGGRKKKRARAILTGT